MKITPAILLLALAADAWGQTLFIPSGGGGIGTSQNGNLGVGTSAPSEKLTLGATEGTNIELYEYAHFGTDYSAWSTILGSNVRAKHGQTDGMELATNYVGSGASAIRLNFGKMEFHTAGPTAVSAYTEGTTFFFPRLVIDSVGNVGIGTTSPQWNLDVMGPTMGARSDNGNATNVMIKNARPGGREWALVSWGDQSGNGAALTGKFSIYDNTVGGHRLVIGTEGNIGIGTINPTQKLSVNGTGKFKEVIVETTGWSDYVFAPDYELQSLSDVEAHIKEHQHLPGIPSANEVAENGVSLGEMQAKLLAKIEEMALHMIELQKQVSAQSARIQHLEVENASHERAP